MKKYTIPFLEECPVPVIKFQMKDGRDVYAMVDCGSSASLVSDKFETEFPDAVLKRKEKGKGCFYGYKGSAEIDIVMLLVTLPGISDSGEPGQVKIIGVIDDLATLRENLMKPSGLEEDVMLVLGNDMLKALDGKLDMKKKTVTLYMKKGRKTNSKKAA